MSDEIKTQHGTIGLLMAEVEQLRRDIVVEENRHKAARDDCLRERRMIVKLHAELAQAKAELCDIKCELALGTETDDEKPIVTIRRLSAKLHEAKAELGAWHSAFGTTQLSHALVVYDSALSELNLLRSRLTSSSKSDTNTP